MDTSERMFDTEGYGPDRAETSVGDRAGHSQFDRSPRARAHLQPAGADDGEEHVDTAALGWNGRDVYVRMSDTRYRFTAIWLDTSDVERRYRIGRGSIADLDRQAVPFV